METVLSILLELSKKNTQDNEDCILYVSEY